MDIVSRGIGTCFEKPVKRSPYRAYLGRGLLFPRPSSLSSDAFWADYTGDLVDVMARGLRYGDAKVLWVAERNDASCLVTWNTRHYRDRTPLPVLTPEEVVAWKS